MGNAAIQLVPDHRREQPWELEAEVAVLGACLIDSDAMVKCAARIRPEHFYREPHRLIYAAMLRVSEPGAPIDPVTLSSDLANRSVRLPGGPERTELDQAGGLEYLGELLEAVPTAANVEWHANIVIERWQRRKLIQVCTEVIRTAYEPEGVPAEEIVRLAEQHVSACAELGSAGTAVRIGRKPPGEDESPLYEVFRRMEEAQQNPGKLIGVATGLPAVDAATGGLQKGDLVIVAARPSMGKTALVTGMALHAAITQQVPVAIFSLEMSRRQVVQRCLCYEAMVDISHVLRGQLREDDFGRLAQAAGHLNSAPLWIEDTGSLSCAQLRTKLRMIAQEEPELGLVIVDYIQLMVGTKEENRTQEVSSISRGLKGLAREFDVPLIALSQLSRAPEQRKDHRPILSDLRESGSIEQDADLVGFLYRPEYYMTKEEAREAGKVGAAEFIIGKQRNGPTGSIDLYFRKECARFESAGEEWAL